MPFHGQKLKRSYAYRVFRFFHFIASYEDLLEYLIPKFCVSPQPQHVHPGTHVPDSSTGDTSPDLCQLISLTVLTATTFFTFRYRICLSSDSSRNISHCPPGPQVLLDCRTTLGLDSTRQAKKSGTCFGDFSHVYRRVVLEVLDPGTSSKGHR